MDLVLKEMCAAKIQLEVNSLAIAVKTNDLRWSCLETKHLLKKTKYLGLGKL